jgi:hypothetical protein
MRKIILVTAAALACTVAAHADNIYFSDFENDPGGWSATGDWQHGIPVGFAGAPYGGPEPVGGYSGDWCWGTVIGGAHNPTLDSYLSQTFDFTGYTDIELRFWEYIESGSPDFDTGKVFVNGNEEYFSDGDSNLAWREVILDLSAYDGMSGVTIEFEFHATSVVERVGWYVDDVGITGIPAPASIALLALAGLARRRRR